MAGRKYGHCTTHYTEALTFVHGATTTQGLSNFSPLRSKTSPPYSST